jgi:hypothetical protein
MSDESTNGQYQRPPFGISQGAASTNAPGSAGVQASDSYGPVVGTPVVSVPGASSQVAASMPRASVVAGDTCSSSADAVVPGTDPLTGLGLSDIASMGPHPDHTLTGHAHPNSTARPA